MSRLARIAALEDALERATAAAIVEQQARAEADGAAAIRAEAQSTPERAFTTDQREVASSEAFGQLR
jgi:hypothetical protein